MKCELAMEQTEKESDMSDEVAEVIVPEVLSKELATVEKDGVALQDVQALRSAFVEMFEGAEKWTKQALTIRVTAADQVREMKLAREARLALREIRCNAENTRKKLKEDSLRRGRAIDGIANVLKALIEPAEEHLMEQEKFAERMEQKRIAELVAKRTAELTPLGVNAAFYNLGEMPEDVYSDLLATSTASHNERIEAARRAEEERIAKERAEAEERARVLAENARLKAEAEAREKQAAEERAAAAKALKDAEDKARREREAVEAEAAKQRDMAEKKARAEAEAREKLEAEIRAREQAEKAKREAEEAAAIKAAAAPDRLKIQLLAGDVRAIVLPEAQTDKGIAVMREIAEKRDGFARWIEGKAAGL